jgi:uncharacterized protein YwgA
MTRNTPLDRSEWLLLALRSARRHRLTAVKLQKSLFVLGERRGEAVGDDYYQFRPYHYGPFSADIYHDADSLANKGLLQVDTSRGQSMREYVLTEEGERAADASARRAPKMAREYLEAVVAWAQPLRFDELVRAVYEAFPETRINSIFREPDAS